jgi:hypothetical protein
VSNELEQYFSLLVKFIGIFLLVTLLELPGCLIVLADDSGGIDYYEHENLIELSKYTFAFPLRLLIKDVKSEGQLLVIYTLNLALLSGLILLVWKQLRKKKKDIPSD